MRTATAALVAFGCIVLSVAVGEPGREAKSGVAQEIDLKGFQAGRPRLRRPEAVKIASAEDLAKAIPDKEWRARLQKQVDFAKDQLVFFAWAGSGTDKLSFKVEGDRKEPVVVFTYSPGKSSDLRSHFRLYAIAKTAKYAIAKTVRR
jgi:hypothetical protein